jgi:hypothetical protein
MGQWCNSKSLMSPQPRNLRLGLPLYSNECQIISPTMPHHRTSKRLNTRRTDASLAGTN